MLQSQCVTHHSFATPPSLATRLSLLLRKVIAPEPCLLCGQGLLAVCPACRALLSGDVLWSQLGHTPLCISSVGHANVMTLLRAFKDDQRVALAADLAEVLREPLIAALEGFPAVDGVLVVPTRPHAWRARGYHPTKVILRGVGIAPLGVISRERRWNDQRGLSVAERRNNLRGAFRAHPSVRGRTFVLVDDVVTSGATALEVIRAVREAGGHVVCVVALSRVTLSRSSVNWAPVALSNTPIKLHG